MESTIRMESTLIVASAVGVNVRATSEFPGTVLRLGPACGERVKVKSECTTVQHTDNGTELRAFELLDGSGWIHDYQTSDPSTPGLRHLTAEDEKEQKATSEWFCPECHMSNSTQRKTCELCDEPRPRRMEENAPEERRRSDPNVTPRLFGPFWGGAIDSGLSDKNRVPVTPLSSKAAMVKEASMDPSPPEVSVTSNNLDGAPKPQPEPEPQLEQKPEPKPEREPDPEDLASSFSTPSQSPTHTPIEAPSPTQPLGHLSLANGLANVEQNLDQDPLFDWRFYVFALVALGMALLVAGRVVFWTAQRASKTSSREL